MKVMQSFSLCLFPLCCISTCHSTQDSPSFTGHSVQPAVLYMLTSCTVHVGLDHRKSPSCFITHVFCLNTINMTSGSFYICMPATSFQLTKYPSYRLRGRAADDLYTGALLLPPPRIYSCTPWRSAVCQGQP